MCWMHNNAERVLGAFAAGALGYFTKREFGDVLVDAMWAVAGGRRYVSAGSAEAHQLEVDAGARAAESSAVGFCRRSSGIPSRFNLCRVRL